MAWLALLLAVVPLAVVVACVASCRPGPGDLAPKEVRSEVERGPVRVSVEVKPAPVRLSDEPKLTLTIDRLKGTTVEKPVFAEALGDFRIVDIREPLPQIKDDREISQQILTLQPTRTGKLPIFPIAARFTDTRPGGDGKQQVVETQRLTVDVSSPLGSDVTSLDELHAGAPPVALPQSARVLLWLLLAAALLAAAGGYFWWRRTRRQKLVVQRQLTPEELAWQELRALWQSGLAERDVKLYYVELTGLVRRYIERSRGVRAPEQTTEEFLREISHRETFSAEERRRLKGFLESADLVKFAAHQPRAEDIQASFERAGEFIGYQQAQEMVA